jgi:hypothetical protein
MLPWEMVGISVTSHALHHRLHSAFQMGRRQKPLFLTPAATHVHHLGIKFTQHFGFKSQFILNQLCTFKNRIGFKSIILLSFIK